jgi:arginase family enzyme
VTVTCTAHGTQRAIEEELAGVDHSIDVIDPAFAPGTGRPGAGSRLPAAGLEISRGLTGTDFLGRDVVEVIILGDPGGLSATFAASVAHEVVSPVALRRLGCETGAR